MPRSDNDGCSYVPVAAAPIWPPIDIRRTLASQEAACDRSGCAGRAVCTGGARESSPTRAPVIDARAGAAQRDRGRPRRRRSRGCRRASRAPDAGRRSCRGSGAGRRRSPPCPRPGKSARPGRCRSRPVALSPECTRNGAARHPGPARALHRRATSHAPGTIHPDASLRTHSLAAEAGAVGGGTWTANTNLVAI